MEKFTEKSIARLLFYHVQQKQHPYCCSSTQCVPGVGECDFLSITKSGFLHEYEIKTSRSDFKADFRNKPSKHSRMAGESITVRKYNGEKSREAYAKGIGGGVYDEYEEIQRPFVNYFWFVCPEGLIKKEELPEYAGLIYIETLVFNEGQTNQREETRTREIAAPKRLHKEKVEDEFVIRMLRSMMFKYFTYIPSDGN